MLTCVKPYVLVWLNLLTKQEISLGCFLVLIFFFPSEKMKFLSLSDTHQSWNLGIWLLQWLLNLNFITICKLFLILFLNSSLTSIWHKFLAVKAEFKVPYLPCLTHLKYEAAPIRGNTVFWGTSCSKKSSEIFRKADKMQNAMGLHGALQWQVYLHECLCLTCDSHA